MSTLVEIEKATTKLSPAEKKELLQFLTASLREGSAPSSGADVGRQLINTLREVSRPMGGKPWNQRDELYER